MAKITDTKVTVTFEDGTWLSFEMDDDHNKVWLSDGADTFEVPRAEVKSFVWLLTEWADTHP